MATQCMGVTVDGVIWRVHYEPNLTPIFATSSGSTKIPEERPAQIFNKSDVTVSIYGQPHRCISDFRKDVIQAIRKATPRPLVVKHFYNGYWV